MPIMGEGAGRRDGTSATGGVVHRIVTMHVTAGIGAGPPRVQQKALSSGIGGTSSGAGGTASSGSWAGGGRGETVAARVATGVATGPSRGKGKVARAGVGGSRKLSRCDVGAGRTTAGSEDDVGDCNRNKAGCCDKFGKPGAGVAGGTSRSTGAETDNRRGIAGRSGNLAGAWAVASGTGKGGYSGSDAVGNEVGVTRAGCGTGRTGVGNRADSAGSSGGAVGAWGAWQTGAADTGEKDSIGVGRGAAVMSAGSALTGEGVGGRATPSGSGSASSSQFNGTGCRDWASEAGDNNMASVLGAAGNRGTSGTARDCEGAGAGDRADSAGRNGRVAEARGAWETGAVGSNSGSGRAGTAAGWHEAGRGGCVWATSRCG